VIVGESTAIRRALALAERYARTRLPVLLVGRREPARSCSPKYSRAERPAGSIGGRQLLRLPRDMVESLLFGHRRGAFTGAVDSAVGHVKRSDGGTLFLDELASLPPEAQGSCCVSSRPAKCNRSVRLPNSGWTYA